MLATVTKRLLKLELTPVLFVVVFAFTGLSVLGRQEGLLVIGQQEVVVDSYPPVTAVEQGESIVLVCRVVGVLPSVTLSYSWTCNGGACEDTEVVSGNRLRIGVANTGNHQGTFRCSVTGSGVSLEGTFDLTVEDGLALIARISGLPDYFIPRDSFITDSALIASGGNKFVLECRSTNRDPLWYHPNGTVVTTNMRVTVYQNANTHRTFLNINDITDLIDGDYTCAGTSISAILGWYIKSTISLDPPTSLTSGSITATSIVVMWSGAGPPVNGYYINWRRTDLGDSATAEYARVTDVMHTLTNLFAGITYNITVWSTDGTRVSSPVSRQVTTSESAPTVPRLLRVVDSSSYQLDWLPPAQPNGAVTYTVQYRTSGSFMDLTTGLTTTHHSAVNLPSGASVTVRVQAVNTAGTSTSNTVVLQVPGVSTSVATNTPTTTTLPAANFCPSEIDEVWSIPWSDTLYGGTDVQNCSSDEGSGLATRKCNNGLWGDPNVNNCEGAIFEEVRINDGRLQKNLNNETLYNGTGLPIREEDLELIANITTTLLNNVDPKRRTSPIFLKDLNTTNIFLDTVSQFANQTDLFAQPNYAETDLLLIADYILGPLYENEWMILNEDEYSGGSSLLLTSIEVISLVLARELGSNNQTTTDPDNGMMYVTYQGERISIRSFQVSPLSSSNSSNEVYTTVIYPNEESDGTPQVCLPGEILAERAGEGGNGSVLVVAGVVMNFTNILPQRFNNKSSIGDLRPSPYLVIAQVLGRVVNDSAKFENSNVKITFGTRAQYCNADCVSWDPGMDPNSSSLESSGWSIEGLSEGDTDSNREVLCSSTHLTSFTILVDYTPGVDQNLEFTIVSYIGCGISLVCLLLSLIFFFYQKKQVIENSVFFVHTNLCLALICGLILFFFIEEGGRQRIEAACSIVTFLIQYAFLSAFFWMLCEGIMMYILLVRVFGAHDRKWHLLFLIIGWGTPLIPAIVTIAVAYGTDKNYFIKTTRCQWLCWLSQREYFIWAFIAPMILLILINLILVIRIMVAIVQFKREQIKRTGVQKENQQLLIYSFKAFICLLPLLGLTWLFGLLAANKLGGETQVFAWLFVICNTLQGCAFFFFHVVRHDKVWNKLEETYCCKRWKEFSTKKSMDDANASEKNKQSFPLPAVANKIFSTNGEADVED